MRCLGELLAQEWAHIPDITDTHVLQLICQSGRALAARLANAERAATETLLRALRSGKSEQTVFNHTAAGFHLGSQGGFMLQVE